jgi:hypothetical protein
VEHLLCSNSQGSDESVQQSTRANTRVGVAGDVSVFVSRTHDVLSADAISLNTKDHTENEKTVKHQDRLGTIWGFQLSMFQGARLLAQWDKKHLDAGFFSRPAVLIIMFEGEGRKM